jgi:stage III sporulation protein AC
MDISFIMKIAGVGMIVAAACQVLSKAGREEQANFVSIAGIIVVLILLVREIGELFDTVKDVFGL